MKVFILFLLLLKEIDSKPSLTLLSRAFENVTRHLFELETRLYIGNYGLDSTTVTTLVLKSLHERTMPFHLRNREFVGEKVRTYASSFLVFNSFGNLRKYNAWTLLRNEFYKPLQFFVYCQNATFKDIESLTLDVQRQAKDINLKHNSISLKLELLHAIQYEYFLIDEAEFVNLMTFVWHSPVKCGKWQLVQVNRFSKVNAKWESNQFVLEKLANFHGCDLVYSVVEYGLGSRFHWNIVPNTAKNLNYRAFGTWTNNSRPLDVVLKKSCYNAFDPHQQFSSSDHKEKLHTFTTFPIEFSPVSLSAPPAENYSEYEKLAMPFDELTWFLIALTFVAAFTTILILYRVRRSTRDFIIGSNIQTPSLNVAQIFFGLGMIAVPRRNFARFMTMMFLLYSLIIRTAWQGKMFEFMQKNVSKPEIQTVEEMIEQGFTFFMEYNFKEKYPESEIAQSCLESKLSPGAAKKSCTIYTESEGFKALLWLPEKLLDPKFKGAIQTDPRVYFALVNVTNGRFLHRVRKEVLHVNNCGMKFMRHHHFHRIFDLKSRQLFTAGIVPHYYYEDKGGTLKFDIHFTELKTQFEHLFVDGPKVLTMKMLEPGFVIWLSSLSLAITAFALEWLQTFKDFLMIKFILLALYRTRDEIGRSSVERTELKHKVVVEGSTEVDVGESTEIFMVEPVEPTNGMGINNVED